MVIFSEERLYIVGTADDKTSEIIPPERLALGVKQENLEIQHFYDTCDTVETKVEMMCNFFPSSVVNGHCVLFVNAEESLVLLAENLSRRGYKIFTYKKGEWESLLKFYTDSDSSVVLITMDMLPRNDFNFRASLVVVNYDLPSYPTDYAYRLIGRVVKVLNFVTMYDWSILLECRKLYSFSLAPFDCWNTMDTSSPPEDSQLSTKRDDSEMSDLLSANKEDDGFASYDKIYESFDDMYLKMQLLVRLNGYGCKNPSEVQKRVIVPLCAGLNVFVHAESEPGKVVSFCSAIVQRCTNMDACQCIVIARALDRVIEIKRVLCELGEYVHFFKVYACGEGGSCHDDLRYFETCQIRKKVVHVVVGTVDRLWNMLKREEISPDDINLVVLDEADFTASGNIDQINKISSKLPETVQVGVFSERMSPVAVEASRVLCSRSKKGAPVKIVVKKNQDVVTIPLEDMLHFVVQSETNKENPDLVGALFDELHENTPRCIIFVSNVYKADLLFTLLKNKPNVRPWVVRRYMDQLYRDMVMRDFSDGSINVIITTYRLVPGFNIRGSLIINLDMTCCLPVDVYRERVARFGTRGGVVINFVDEDSLWSLLNLNCKSDVYFEELPKKFAYLFPMDSTGGRWVR